MLQGKARLGAIVHQKNAAALALTAVKNEDQREFAKLVDSFKSQFNEGARVQVRLMVEQQWWGVQCPVVVLIVVWWMRAEQAFPVVSWGPPA